MEKTAQALMGDRRNITEYEGAEHVPYPLSQPLTFKELSPYLDQDILVTFTVKVPLAEVAQAKDASLTSWIQKRWLGDMAAISGPEYRAVGATFDEFSSYFSGDVHLQVTCNLIEWG